MSCYIHSPQKRLITILSIFHLTKISENVSLRSPECRQESQEGEAVSYQWGLNYQKLLSIFHSIYFLWCWNLLSLLVFYLFDFWFLLPFLKLPVRAIVLSAEHWTCQRQLERPPRFGSLNHHIAAAPEADPHIKSHLASWTQGSHP